MPLGMEVSLSPGEFVLDGDPVPLPKRGEGRSPLPNFKVENFEMGPEVVAFQAIAIFLALEQQRILVKTSSESV